MKRKTLILFTLSCLTIHGAWALNANTKAPLYQHLLEVNAQWKQIEPTAEQLKPVSFADDTRRIQAHLLNVEAYLRAQNTDQYSKQQVAKRMQLLDMLHNYALAGVFPKNYDFDKRIPYFIDAHNTACAVGYLIIEDGHKQLAEMIKYNNNYQYLLDMQYPELTAWVAQSGFSAQELATIQPAYMANTPFTNLTNGGGTNGSVDVLLNDQLNNDLYVGGEFTSVNSQSGFSNIALFDGERWNTLKGGLDGPVHAVAVYDGAIYVGGDFSGSVSGVASEGLIKWNGTDWEAVYTADLYGAVYTLKAFNGKLYVGGDFQLPTGAIRGYLIALNGNTPEYLPDFPMGPVRSLAIHNGELVIGGNFNTLNDQTNVSNLVSMDMQGNITDFNGGFNSTVMALASFQNALVVGGASAGPLDTNMTSFAFYLNDSIGWRDLSPDLTMASADTIRSLNIVDNQLYVGGNFSCCWNQIIMFYGRNLGEFHLNNGYGSITMLTTFNNSVNSISSYANELAVGGTFDSVEFGGMGSPLVQQDLGGLALKGEQSIVVNDTSTGVSAGTLGMNGLSAYPVPASHVVNFQFTGPSESKSLSVHQLNGQQMYHESVYGKQVQLDVADWPAGLYFYQVETNSGTTHTGKLLIE